MRRHTKSSRIISVDASGEVQSVDTAHARATRERLGQLAWLLDSSIRIPGTRFTIGADAVIGLIPVFGDFVGVLISSYILREAAQLGAPKSVLLRMAFNVGVEGLVGSFPVVGDIFDAAWKANQRNVRLLNRWLEQPKKAERASKLFGAVLVLSVASFLLLVMLGVFLFVRWLFSLF
jgi:hypothetical protein